VERTLYYDDPACAKTGGLPPAILRLDGLLGLELGAHAALAAGGLILVDDTLLSGAVDDLDALLEDVTSAVGGAVEEGFIKLFDGGTHGAQAPAIAGAGLEILTNTLASRTGVSHCGGPYDAETKPNTIRPTVGNCRASIIGGTPRDFHYV
jgi:hypothetical protein